MTFLKSTELNRFIAKQKFYENANITTRLKDAFINEVEKITWQNKISPATMNIEKSKTAITEIEVFVIKLKTTNFNYDIIKTIDKAIPQYILFILEYGDLKKTMISFKELKGEVITILETYETKWQQDLEIAIDGGSIDKIYENLILQISDGNITAKSTDIKQAIINSKEITRIKGLIEALSKRIKNEPQFNKQIEMNKELKKLENELERVKNG